jgi:hypothetical protein
MLSDVSLMMESMTSRNKASRTSGVDQLLHASNTLTSLAESDALLKAGESATSKSPSVQRKRQREDASPAPYSRKVKNSAPRLEGRRSNSDSDSSHGGTSSKPKRGRPKKIVSTPTTSLPQRGRPRKEKCIVQVNIRTL